MDNEQKNPQGGIINNFYGSITNYNIINGSATFNNSHEEKNKKRVRNNCFWVLLKCWPQNADGVRNGLPVATE